MPTRIVNRKNVIKRLVINCISTGAIVPVINCIPQIFCFPYSIKGFICKFVVFCVFSEAWFYYSHRLMHTRYFYKFHADHHAFIRGNALSALYCSPVEMVLTNQLSVTIPYFLMGFSFWEMSVVNIITALSVIRGHSGGYFIKNLPKWLPKSVICSLDHDIHHHALDCNYGIFYILDRWHGTYQPKLTKRFSNTTS